MHLRNFVLIDREHLYAFGGAVWTRAVTHWIRLVQFAREIRTIVI